MLKVLLKYSIRQYLFSRKPKKGNLRIPSWVKYVLLIGFFTLMYTMGCRDLAESLHYYGMDAAYFGIIYVIVAMLLLAADAVYAQNSLFKSKYNDLLLSMPIENRDILLSRLAEIYVYNLIIQLMGWLPGSIGWFMGVGFNLLQLILMILAVLFAPLLFIAIGTLLGYVINKISLRLKHPTTAKMLITFVFLGIYFFFVFGSQNLMDDLMYGAGDLDKILSWILPAGWIGKAIGEKNILYLLLFALLNVAAIAATVLILQKSYAGVMMTTQNKVTVKYVKKDVRSKSVMGALLKREFRHWTSSYTYLANTAMALFFLVIGTVFLIFRGRYVADLFIGFEYYDPRISLYICIVIILIIESMMASFMVSSASISLEGQSVGVLRSLPVEGKTVLLSKVLFHYLIAAPLVLLPSVITIILFRPILLVGMLLILIPQTFLLMTGMLGLCYNLKYYKLDWANEAQVVKRGFPVFLSMIGNYLLIALQIAPYLQWMMDVVEPEIYMLGLFAVMVAVCTVLYFVIAGWGSRRYERLGE